MCPFITLIMAIPQDSSHQWNWILFQSLTAINYRLVLTTLYDRMLIFTDEQGEG